VNAFVAVDLCGWNNFRPRIHCPVPTQNHLDQTLPCPFDDLLSKLPPILQCCWEQPPNKGNNDDVDGKNDCCSRGNWEAMKWRCTDIEARWAILDPSPMILAFLKIFNSSNFSNMH
jgi:hypothetical protein